MAEVKMEKAETRGRKKLHHMRVHPMENGAMVTHHAVSQESYGPGYEEKPHKSLIFSKEDGEEMADHITKHAKMSTGESENEMEAENEGQQAAESEEA